MEAVYEEALKKELLSSEIPFESQVKLNVFYDGQQLKKFYIADFICYGKIILEIKSVDQVPNAFYSQIKNYLTATKIELGMLINFGQPSLTYKRVINSNDLR